MNFLKNIISSAIGFMMAIGLLIIFVLILAVAIGSDEEIKVSDTSILKIELTTEVKDYAPFEMDPFSELFGIPPRYVGLNSIIEAIQNAAYDNRIKGISIEANGMSGGISQLNAVRNALIDFKSSGKFVLAYADAYGQKEYFLSSVADSLFVSPVGQVDLKGLSSEILFFKDFQDKYGVKMEVIRHGKYKSAVEPFLENKMSASNRTQMKELLESLWFDMTDAISISRDVPVEKLNAIADELLGRTAELSVAHQLVDGAVYNDEYKLKLESLLADDSYATIDLLDYINSNRTFDFEMDQNSDKIAVIYGQGDIIYGEGDEDTIGQGIMVEAIDEAKNDDSVKNHNSDKNNEK